MELFKSAFQVILSHSLMKIVMGSMTIAVELLMKIIQKKHAE